MAFDINQPVFSDGEFLEKQGHRYIDQLVELFNASPEGQALRSQGEDAGWSSTVLEYAFTYLGISLPEVDGAALDEILFEIFPAKVAVPPEDADEIIREQRAFWSFLKREFALARADECLELLNDEKAVDDLRAALADTSQYGMAKSILMMGRNRGFDMSTEEGIGKWLNTYNQEVSSGNPSLALPPMGFGGGTGYGFSPGKSSVSKKAKAKRKMEKASRKKNRRKR